MNSEQEGSAIYNWGSTAILTLINNHFHDNDSINLVNSTRAQVILIGTNIIK